MEEEFDFSDIVDQTSPPQGEDFDFSDVVESGIPLGGVLSGPALIDKAVDYIDSGVKNINKGVFGGVFSVLKMEGALEQSMGIKNPIQSILEDVGAIDPSDPWALQAGRSMENFIDENNVSREGVNETYQQVMQGVGQAGLMMATAGTGAAPALTQTATKVPSLLQATGAAAKQIGRQAASPVGVLGGSMTAAPEWEAAKAAGLSDEDAFEVLLQNYAVGQTEAIPIQNLLGRLNRVTGNGIVNTLKNMGVGSVEEATQEAIQTYLTNQIAQENYDPDRDPLFQVIESAKVGGFVGAILPGAAGLVLSADKRVPIERKLAEVQATQAINESSTGDPQIDAAIDAEAQIDPVDKQVLEEVKVAQAVQEEQQQVEAQEKIQEQIEEANQPAENSETKSAEEAEIKPTQTPEYKLAVAKVEELQKKFAELPIEENADQLLFDLREARQALQKIAGKTKPGTSRKTNIQKQIEDTTGVTKPEKSVKMTPAQAIKQQVQTFYKGVSEGVKRGQKGTNELVAKVQEAVKEFPLTPQQTSRLLSKIKKTNLFTPGSVSRLNEFVDKITTDAEYADKLTQAQDINKKLRKLSKSSSENLQNYKVIAKQFTAINPEDTFINPHLELGNKILASLTSPTSDKYVPLDVASAQEYITDLQTKINEYQDAEIEKSSSDPEEKSGKLRTTLKFAQEALKEKDLSDFDEVDRQVIENIKGLDPNSLTDSQLITAIRVTDNIVENDDLSNTGTIEVIVTSKKNLGEKLEKFKDTVRKDIKAIGKLGGNIYQQFSRVFGDSGIASEVQQATGITELWNAGSRVENQEIKLTRELKDKIQEVNKKYKTKVQDLPNQVRLVIYSELVKNYGDDSHIAKVKNNIMRTIREYEKTDPKEAEAWKEVWPEFQNVETVEDAKLSPGLMEIWKFFNTKFNNDINPRLSKISTELHNKPYLEANNYTHSESTRLTDTSGAKEQFGEDIQTSKKVRPEQSKTAITATRNLRQGYGYSSDWIEAQLRGYRDSLYDIEASKPKALVKEAVYTPEFEELVGGRDNAEIVRRMVEAGERIQTGKGGRSSNDAVRFLNTTTSFLRNIGSVRALASLSQPTKQVPSVWTKAFFNHLGSGSVREFFKGIGAINLMGPDSNLNKLFDMYSIGVRGERLGGIERGEAIAYRLSPSGKGLNRIADYMRTKSEAFSRTVLAPLTKSDVYAARTTWLGYYLQSLKESGVASVDLNNEYKIQYDPVRKKAAAFAEQMVAETQVPSNPATLAQIIRNENDSGWNFAKNILLPFSTYSTTAKYRHLQDIDKFLRNPSTRTAGAVAGNAFEIAAFAGIAYGLLPYYKDWIKEGVTAIFGVDSPDEDEEEKKEKRKKALVSNMINQAFPLTVGSLGDKATSSTVNFLAYLSDNPDASYSQWKKDTGGLMYDQPIDLGLFALGAEPIVETGKGVIDLTNAVSGEPVTQTNFFGNTKEMVLDDNQKNLLAFKTLMELGGIIGLTEHDLYTQVAKAYKDQFKSKSTPSGNTLRPRPRPRPIPVR